MSTQGTGQPALTVWSLVDLHPRFTPAAVTQILDAERLIARGTTYGCKDRRLVDPFAVEAQHEISRAEARCLRRRTRLHLGEYDALVRFEIWHGANGIR